MIKSICAACALLIATSAKPIFAGAQVLHEKRTVNEMGEVLAMAQAQADMGKEVLIAFDTDNTLLTADQDLGSEPWSDDVLDSTKGFFKDISRPETKQIYEQRYSQALNFWFSVAKAMAGQNKMRLVEESDAQGIDRLQKNRIKTMALTSRAAVLLEATIRQFVDLEIDFSRSAFGSDWIEFSVPGLPWPVSYKKGVCAGGTDKGKALVYLMDRMNYHPDVVIYVDNKQKETDSVYDALAGTATSVIAYRYGKMDGALDAYTRGDRSLARMETKVFKESGRIISNDEASRMIFQDGPVTLEETNELIFGTSDPSAP